MKKTKKLLLAVLSILTVGFCTLGVTGCDFLGNGDDSKKSEYSQMDDEKEGKDEEREDEEEKSDGEESEADKENGDDEAEYSEGLEYELSECKTYYIVSGIGTCADSKIVIPEEHKGVPVKNIGDYAFKECTATSITMPDNITTIEEGAFYWCRGLTDIKIPDSVTTIGKGAFYACSYLECVTMGNGVTTIEEAAFSGCIALKNITLSSSLTSIGTGAFYWCSTLTTITIPDGVTRIGENAFALCYDLINIKFSGKTEKWNSLEKGSEWNKSVPAIVVTCADGEVEI